MEIGSVVWLLASPMEMALEGEEGRSWTQGVGGRWSKRPR